jgi:predicted enzyme related to lactoylglutathione lyase
VSAGQPASDWARPLVHWAVEARDPGALAEFYAALFNWEIGDGPVRAISAGVGGPEGGPAGHLIGAGESRVVLFFQVRELRASLERARELGGSVVAEPFDVPGGPTLARILDPEGNAVMLVQQ